MNARPLALAGLSILFLIFVSGCLTPNGPLPGENPNGGTDGPNIPSSSGWYAYSPVQAETNPWQIYQSGLNNGKTEIEQVKKWMEGNGILATEYGFVPRDDIDVTCQALNCPRGDLLIMHPSNEASASFLQTSGFVPYHAVGIFLSRPMEDADAFNVTLVNAGGETIYYGGCNEFIPILLTTEGEIPLPPKQCIWEGIPSPLESGMAQKIEWSPQGEGDYYLSFSYAKGCMNDTPLSQAECTFNGNVASTPFSFEGNETLEFVKMEYTITQCRTNPWQEPESTATPEEDLEDFTNWMNEHGIHPQSIQYIPPAEGTMICLACSCGQGDYYRIVIPIAQKDDAEEEGFTYIGPHITTITPPDLEGIQWFVATPFQCYANKWNVEKKPIHSAETDISTMKEWLEGKGVKVTHLTYLPGYTLTQECLKKSTDKYGVGVSDDESASLLPSLGFVAAGTTQVKAFTDTSAIEPLTLIYKSKFCTAPPWGEPELSNGNEETASIEAARWLGEKGMELYAGPTIHQINPSFSGSCDTDSGHALQVTVPAWTKPHLLASGFIAPSYSFEQQQVQVYPPLEEEGDPTP